MGIKRNKLIIILGPTASGKTDLSIKMAEEFKGEIVSADSRQIYKRMDIGTSKIKKEEMEGIPHYLLSIIEPDKKFSAADYQKKAVKKIKEIQRKGKVPFLVGGSPFYIFSVVEGWIFPKIKKDPRIRRRLEKRSKEELYQMLWEIDRKRAENIDKNNKRRLVRALEIAKQLGEVPKLEKKPQFNPLLIGLKISKKELRKRIEKRIEKMFKEGLEKEVRKLIKKNIEIKSIGYQEFIPYFKGKITKEELKEKIAVNTFQFAKRQMTWFKRYKNINWIENHQEAENLIKEFLNKKESS